jgi:flavin reductase (DIM6/NTAB) family NADH-FMN oxidoreductase RutF
MARATALPLPPAQPSAAESVDAAELRHCLGMFPTGVTIITTCDHAGRPVGVTANSFNSVSLEPPLVLWSLRTSSHSLPAFRRAGRFAINILGQQHRELSSTFARGGPDKWQGIDYVEGWTGVPVLPGSAGIIECRSYSEHLAGDHMIFIGQVVRLEIQATDDPLVFFRGRYRALSAADAGS